MKIPQGKRGPTYETKGIKMNQITMEPGMAIKVYFVQILTQYYYVLLVNNASLQRLTL